VAQCERLQDEHQQLQKDNLAAGKDRRQVLSDITDATNDFDNHAQEATREKRGLRDNLVDLEDTLRRLRDQFSNVTLENKNLQLVVDTESALKDAKATAETQAVTTVNRDLTEQSDRLDRTIEEENDKKGEAKRILDDLTAKHEAATKEFEKTIKEAEKEKQEAQKALDELRKKIQSTNQGNQKLENEVDTNEKTIGRLSAEISQLQIDLQALKDKNQSEINILESQRKENEVTITNFRNQLTQADHDFAKIRILIQKTENEVQYLNSEKDKHESQNYQKRIDDFAHSITDSEKKAHDLAEELGRMN